MSQLHLANFPSACVSLCGYHSSPDQQRKQRAQKTKCRLEYNRHVVLLLQQVIHWTPEKIVEPYVTSAMLQEVKSRSKWISTSTPIEIAIREQAEIIRERNAGWPWLLKEEQLVTRAPYATNKYPLNETLADGTNQWVFKPRFKLAKVKQDCILLNSQVLQESVFPILLKHHSTVSALAAVCQQSFEVVGFFMEHWNISDGSLLDTDYDDTPVFPGLYVTVTPFRKPGRQFIKAKHQLRALQNLTKSIVYHGTNLRILHLHRIPMLNMNVLDLIVPEMINLEVLGIYRCPLIHVGHLMPLLNVLQLVRPNSTHRPRPQLDFSPRWHSGPPGGYTYGVTYDNPGFNTCLAIWQIVSQALPQAIMQGVDLISVDSAFRQWLEMGLLAQVPETIYAILYETDIEALAAQLDYGNTGGRRHKLRGLSTWYYTCDSCKVSQLGIFYSAYDLKNSEEWPLMPLHCLGCRLKMHLDGERDHNKREFNRIVNERWLKLSPQNEHYAEVDENGEPQPYITENVRLALNEIQILRGLFTANQWDVKDNGIFEPIQAARPANTLVSPVVGEAAMGGAQPLW